MKKPTKKTIALKKTTPNLVKKAKFDASPVSRKEVEAIKSKLRKKANKADALKVARTELETEKKKLARKAHLKLMESLYQKTKKSGK